LGIGIDLALGGADNDQRLARTRDEANELKLLHQTRGK
jgi:hypothetical protein